MNVIGESLRQSFAIVEFLHDLKKLVELVLNFIFCHHGLEIVHHLDEHSNTVGKDHDSEEKDHGAEYSFVIGFGMKVAESHGG